MRIQSRNFLPWRGAAGDRTIILPTAVLVSVAQRQLVDHELTRGAQSWERPKIQTFEGWLQQCWHQARYVEGDVPTLLSASQELLVWRKVIEDHHTNLFDVDSTAQLAQRTAQVVADWQVPLDGEAWNDHEDAAWFRRWHKDVETACQRKGWMTLGQVRRALPVWIHRGLLDPGQVELVWWGELTPALRDVVRSLGTSATVEHGTAQTAAARTKWQHYETFDQELEAAARWARGAFEQAPKQSTAVLVPGLRDCRTLVDRVFGGVFFPGLADKPDVRHSVYHVAARTPLEQEPVIAAGLLIAELLQPRLDIAKACTLLRSPYLDGATEERSERAAADLRLRRTRELEVSFREIRWASRDCEGLSKVWLEASDVMSRMRAVMEVGEWSELITRLLLAVGWPGNHALSEREQEVLTGWDKALLSMDGLGMVVGTIRFEAAMVLLRKQLKRGGVERGDWTSPIQILDASSAEGLSFDAAVAVGLGEERWSTPAFLSPMIPFDVQRMCGIPGSSAESARRVADRAAAALVQCAPVVYGSCSGELSSAVRRAFSPKASKLRVERWAEKTSAATMGTAKLETIEDGQAPRYVAAEASRGGTSLLRAQSLCPFKAFAENRLRAQSPDEACFGFDARDRGSFLHKALEVVWRKLGGQQQLLGYSPEALDELIREALSEAVRYAEYGNEQDSHFHEETMAAEHERLHGLLRAWLRVEAARRPFQVAALEEQSEIDLAGLRLRVRADRVDRLSNGKLLLIDYKSGEQNLKKLKVPRPEEPQLMVYATKLGQEVEGLYFAQIKAGAVRPIGMSREQQFADEKGKRKLDTGEWSGDKWPGQLAVWSETVAKLATDFVTGVADVDPKSHETCNYCGAKPFCRIAEVKSANDSEEEGE